VWPYDSRWDDPERTVALGRAVSRSQFASLLTRQLEIRAAREAPRGRVPAGVRRPCSYVHYTLPSGRKSTRYLTRTLWRSSSVHLLEKTFKRVYEPIFAGMWSEHCNALKSGHQWKARWIIARTTLQLLNTIWTFLGFCSGCGRSEDNFRCYTPLTYRIRFLAPGQGSCIIGPQSFRRKPGYQEGQSGDK
jgi:hypothetical protein